ncbi:MAG: hypothetical protein GF381_04400 [Candidatus Pacebacteria bacterium]|nr:hypothetical protein [Candidatus Paceibacterota bacterium]
MMKYYLGVNGGATSSRFVLADQLGNVLTEGEAGPMSFVAQSRQTVLDNLRQGLEQVTSKFFLDESTEGQSSDFEIIYAVLGIASVDTDQEEQEVAEVIRPVLEEFSVNQFTVINDAITALVNGTQREDAVILISGTGSNCYGQNEKGREAKAGGYDYLLSDQGSGYALGLAALKAGLKSYDQRGQKTVLEQKLVKHFGVDDFSQLKSVVYQPDLSKTEVAELALLVFEGLEQDDLVCRELIDLAAKELWLMVATVVERLNLSEQPFDLVLEGSVAQSAAMIKRLSSLLKTDYSQAELVLPHQSAVYGALELAMTGS